LQPSIGWVLDLFWDLYFSEFGCVGFDTTGVFEYFGCDFGLVLFYVIFWFHVRTLSFFSISPVGLLSFFGLIIFLGIWYRGLGVLFRIWMSSTWHLLIFTVYVPTLLYPSIYTLPIDYLPVYSSFYLFLSWVSFEHWSAESWIRHSNHWAMELWMNVARVAINRRLMCGQNCNSVKFLFIPNLRFIYMTYFGNLLFLAESGFEPTIFGLPIHCYNHYTNRGVLSQVLTWPVG
jgi:hypothetical protein